MNNSATFLGIGGAIAFFNSPTFAQITPDTNLPINSAVTSRGNTLEITGGTRAGGNLFHSFGQFSVPTGTQAFFNNASDIQNIVSRVTGGSISNINGLIRANGAANLFLINPNGIIFGPNAQLNIGGSFLASTANSVEFADGSTYSATNPQAPPLLTVNVPIGLQFGQNPGSIRVQGPDPKPIVASSSPLFLQERSLSIPPEVIVIETLNRIQNAISPFLNSEVGLQVQPGRTLALVGGNVTLESGILTAGKNSQTEPGGRIELGSVGGFSSVSLATTANGWTLGYEGVSTFRDIRLSKQSLVNATGSNGGEIQVRCSGCTISDTSAIFAATLGDRNGGEISFKAEQLNIESSSIVGAVTLSSGKSSDVNLETSSLTIRDAFLGSLSLSQGNAGNLTVRATDLVTLSGTLFDGRLPSGIFAATGVAGEGGNLAIATKHLIVRDGAQIAVTTGGSAKAGTAEVKASESVELIGESASGLFASGIFASSFASGSAGDLTIETPQLIVRNGAAISAATREGLGGKIVVRASDFVQVIGTTTNGQFASDLSTNTLGGGNAGDLQIETGNLIVRDGGQVTASTNGGGDGGTVDIRASTVELIGGISANSQLITGVLARSFANGKAGDVRIFADRLIVRNEAQITVASDGLGAAGDLRVEAGEVRLDNGKIAAETRSGDRGNITLQTGALQMRNNSNITTNATGTATGGNIDIKTDVLAALENSDISANSIGNFGGKVDISALGIFLQNIDGTQVKRKATPFTSDVTATSQLGPQFDGVVTLKTPEVDPTAGIATLPQEVAREPIPQNPCTVAGNRSEFVNIGRGGLPPNVAEIINLDVANESHSTAASEQIVEATGLEKSPDGKVHLVARSPVATSNSSWQTFVSCTLSPHYPFFRR